MCIVRFALHVKTCSFCLCFLLLLTLLWFLLCRLTAEEVESIEADTANRWQGVCISRASPTPSESAATVKSLIKSFDLGCSGMLYTVVGFFSFFLSDKYVSLVIFFVLLLSGNVLSVLGSDVLSVKCHCVIGSLFC